MNGAGWDMAAGSDTGLIRLRNEDSVRIWPEWGIAILSDGMGGHRAGDVASRIAVETVESVLDLPAPKAEEITLTEQLLTDSVQRANAAIVAAGNSKSAYAGMGATIVVVGFQGEEFIAVHVGDSRLYRYRSGELKQLTVDHTLAERYVREGVLHRNQAQVWAGRNILIKALGIDETAVPDVTRGTVHRDDLYLICSDGLTDAVPLPVLQQLLERHWPSLQAQVGGLIAAANDHGGPDNVSVVLARMLVEHQSDCAGDISGGDDCDTGR